MQRLSGVFWRPVLGGFTPGQEAMGVGVGIYLRAVIMEVKEC
jgi:hypothetical protein